MSARIVVKKKKMQFLMTQISTPSLSNPVSNQTYMMPKAKAAFSIAHSLLTLTPTIVPDTVNRPKSASYERPWFQCEQSAFAIPRRQYTAPMKAPTNSRSMKATKLAECLAREYRNRVPMAQTAPSTETMKRTRMDRGVSRFWSL
jgi:hypothetical protein